MVESSKFSIENRQKIFEEATANTFDFVFTNCGFNEVLFCLIASGLGYRCALFCDKDFSTQLHTVVDSKNAAAKTILSLRERFPHLILPDEFLHIRKETRGIARLFSSSIKKKDLQRYESLIDLPENSSVLLEKEFKINSNRLLISIIKSAFDAGICILNHAEYEKGEPNQLIIRDGLNLTKKSYSIRYNTHLHFEKKMDEEKSSITICIEKKDLNLKRSLKFYVEGNLVRLIRHQDYFLLISDCDDVKSDFVTKVLHELSSLFVDGISFNEDDIISTQILSVNTNSNLKDELSNLESYCKLHLNVSGSEFVDRLHRFSIIDSHFEGRMEIQELIEFADFKFDEAKQTGIHPISFKNVFYRFGSETERLTELAYEWRSKYGPGEKLWQNVQLWYLYNHEMICSMDDYYARISSINKTNSSNLSIDEDVMNKCLFV